MDSVPEEFRIALAFAIIKLKSSVKNETAMWKRKFDDLQEDFYLFHGNLSSFRNHPSLEKPSLCHPDESTEKGYEGDLMSTHKRGNVHENVHENVFDSVEKRTKKMMSSTECCYCISCTTRSKLYKSITNVRSVFQMNEANPEKGVKIYPSFCSESKERSRKDEFTSKYFRKLILDSFKLICKSQKLPANHVLESYLKEAMAYISDCNFHSKEASSSELCEETGMVIWSLLVKIINSNVTMPSFDHGRKETEEEKQNKVEVGREEKEDVYTDCSFSETMSCMGSQRMNDYAFTHRILHLLLSLLLLSNCDHLKSTVLLLCTRQLEDVAKRWLREEQDAEDSLVEEKEEKERKEEMEEIMEMERDVQEYEVIFFLLEIAFHLIKAEKNQNKQSEKKEHGFIFSRHFSFMNVFKSSNNFCVKGILFSHFCSKIAMINDLID